MSLTPQEAKRVLEERRKKTSEKKESRGKFTEGLGFAFGHHPEYEQQAGAATKDWLTNIVNAVKSKSAGKEYIPQKTGEGMFYDFTQGALGSALTAPFGALGLSGRVGGEAGLSALMAQDTQKGLESGLATAAIAESIPFLGKFLRSGVDIFTRKDYTSDLMQKMTEDYTSKKADALSHLKPIINKFGNYRLTKDQVGNIKNVFDENKKFLGPDAKAELDLFINRPTIGNAQHFQSVLGQNVRGLDQFDISNKHAIQSYNQLRESVLDSMGQRFDKISPNAKKEYGTFREKYSKNVGSYENNPALSKIVHGQIKGMTPNKVDMALGKAVQGDYSNVPASHNIQNYAKTMENKLKRSELYGEGAKVGSGLAGAATGYSMYGPLGAVGYMAGPVAGQIGSSVGKVVQSDPLRDALMKIYPGFRAGLYGQGVIPEEEY